MAVNGSNPKRHRCKCVGYCIPYKSPHSEISRSFSDLKRLEGAKDQEKDTGNDCDSD